MINSIGQVLCNNKLGQISASKIKPNFGLKNLKNLATINDKSIGKNTWVIGSLLIVIYLSHSIKLLLVQLLTNKLYSGYN